MPEPEEAPASGTRAFTHFMGVTEVPAAPQRIVTLTDQNALLPLLELGVKPIASAGRLRDDGTGIFRRPEGFDLSGIQFVGDFTEPDLERIAALDPDLVVGYEFQDDMYATVSQIAPTVYIQLFERSISEVLADFAELTGTTDRYQAGGEPSGDASDDGEASPLFANLGAVRAGQYREIDGERTVGAAYTPMFRFIEVLREILTAEDFDPHVVRETAA